jgi:hypothetical protein
MPIDYQVGEGGRFVHMAAGEHLGPDELLDCVRRLYADPAARPGFLLLVDLSRTARVGVTHETLEQIVPVIRSDPERRRGGKTAIVAATNASFELSRFYEQLAGAENVDVIVFNSVDVAKIWLGVA